MILEPYSKGFFLIPVLILCFLVVSCRESKDKLYPTHTSPTLTLGEHFYFLDGGGQFPYKNIAIATGDTGFEEYKENGITKTRLIITILFEGENESMEIHAHVGQVIEFNGYTIRILEIIPETRNWPRYLGFTISEP